VLTLIDLLPRAGGGETFAAEVALGLDPARFERYLCVSRGPRAADPADAIDAADLDRLRDGGVHVLGLGRTSRLALWRWRPLLSLLRAQGIDVLHAHKYGSNIWGSLIGTAAGVEAIVCHEHSWAFEGDRLRRFLDRNMIGRLADRVIAVSREDERRMIEVEGIPDERVEFVPLGINALDPPDPADDLRRELGIDAAAPVIGAVGGLRPEKGLPVLLEAAPLLRQSFPTLRVLIVGEGEQRAELEAQVDRLGLGEAVILTGYRRDVPNVLASLDVALLCSEREGSPLAILEYMDAARPIVATRVGGVPDLIEDGVQGRLVPPGDPAALSEAVGTLLGDRDEARRLGEAARERRRREFTIEATVRRLEAIYEELTTPGRPRSRDRLSGD
jgi:glycosyltransferase involved in cell wall biosynthesis